MKILKKLLRTKKLLYIFIAAAVLYGCSGKSGKEDFAVRVNKNYLTKSEVDSLSSFSNEYKSEVIRNWINRELLYQEAAKEGILDSKEFKDIIENSRKELAASLMLRKIGEKQDYKTDLQSVQSYYQNHQNEYRSEEDSYILNILNVKDEQKAIKLHSLLLENSWNRVITASNSENQGIRSEQNVWKSASEIHPSSLLRAVNELNPGEISIVINDGSNSFFIVQLINKFPKGTIPPFELIKSEVEKRYTLEMRNKYIREYLEGLYSNNDIEIRTGKK